MLLKDGKVAAYASSKLQPFQGHSSIHDLELDATVFGLKFWRHYLQKIYIDYKC